jgi:hypothetical protein
MTTAALDFISSEETTVAGDKHQVKRKSKHTTDILMFLTRSPFFVARSSLCFIIPTLLSDFVLTKQYYMK